MSPAASIADHWADRDVYGLIVSALERASKSLESLTVEDLALVDHFHARGFPATVDLADRLPVESDHHLLDIGCGIGGPARYFAQRFGCKVSGVDITGPFVEAANKLTALLGMGDQVVIEQGVGEQLPFGDGSFDGAYAQHVTMNVADRERFFGEAWRAPKPGGFFALTEHGLGPNGQPAPSRALVRGRDGRVSRQTVGDPSAPRPRRVCGFGERGHRTEIPGRVPSRARARRSRGAAAARPARADWPDRAREDAKLRPGTSRKRAPACANGVS